MLENELFEHVEGGFTIFIIELPDGFELKPCGRAAIDLSTSG